MTEPVESDAAARADRNGLARSYVEVFDFVRRRARGGDVVARGFERELTNAYLPPPDHRMVRRWLADVTAERRLFDRSSDPWVAQQLLADMQAWETRAPGASAAIWAEVVTALRSGAHG
jgi:hypothetical protein